MMPATASLLVAKYRGHERSIAFGIWGAVAAAASAVGPILGGYLTSHYTWRWGFRINVFVAALLVAGSIIIEDNQPRHAKQIDFLGVLLSAAGLFFIVFGIIESPTYGWLRARRTFEGIPLGPISIVPVSIVAGLIVIVVFALWERRIERAGGTPIVSMQLFRNTAYVAGASVTGTLMLAQNGVIFALPVFLQSVLMLDAFHTGLSLVPLSIMLLIASPAAGFLSKRIPHKRLVQAGLVVSFFALFVLRWPLAANMNARASTLRPSMARTSRSRADTHRFASSRARGLAGSVEGGDAARADEPSSAPL